MKKRVQLIELLKKLAEPFIVIAIAVLLAGTFFTGQAPHDFFIYDKASIIFIFSSFIVGHCYLGVDTLKDCTALNNKLKCKIFAALKTLIITLILNSILFYSIFNHYNLSEFVAIIYFILSWLAGFCLQLYFLNIKESALKQLVEQK